MPQLNETQQARLEELQLIKLNLLSQKESIQAKRGSVYDVMQNIDDIWGNYQDILEQNTAGDLGDGFWNLTNSQFFNQTNNTSERESVWIQKVWYHYRINKGYNPDDSPTSNKKLRDCLDDTSNKAYYTAENAAGRGVDRVHPYRS